MNYKLKRKTIKNLIDARRLMKEAIGITDKLWAGYRPWMAFLGVSESDWQICVDEANKAGI